MSYYVKDGYIWEEKDDGNMKTCICPNLKIEPDQTEYSGIANEIVTINLTLKDFFNEVVTEYTEIVITCDKFQCEKLLLYFENGITSFDVVFDSAGEYVLYPATLDGTPITGEVKVVIV